jgi:23S rRNA (pseudouridine1915-N3)-methyltransferase
MKIRVVAVGRLKEAHWRDAADEYLRRLKPYATVEMTEVSDRDLGGDEGRAVAAEGADVLKALPADAHVIALDMGGPLRTSENFAGRLGSLMLDGDRKSVV